MLYLQVVLGLVLLVAGGDTLVRGSVGIARHFGMSPLLIGLVLVGFGTSMPELMTSILAALNDAPGIAVGNVVGSNIANILLILGISAVIAPLATDPAAMRRDGAVVTLAAIAVVALALLGEAGRISGSMLLAGLAVYLVVTYRMETGQTTPSAEFHRAEAEASTAQPFTEKLPFLIFLTIAGLAMTLGGAHYLVAGATGLARQAGISEAVIGLTIVAVGTSLPELVTSVVAAFKRQSDIALGNVIGSNIYNILGILGATALIKPIAIPAEIMDRDIWVMLAATLALVFFAFTGWKITRREGAAMLFGYALYMGYLATIAH
ncbi:cation:H+ antiporter [Roseibium hamelinense]|uniref:Cation:H+ antiporter n=1 Tax=Roseibium hamelinense TaxID=150831 RepID=A0A562TA28_9HYPH|nr:calcium/sodium antiporter [Roseibium hamelinense]MTI45177.1 calcium/sodium antiporter [Roseibium hamelinense]TWI90462.1 cation:H+ antiporter [Roseibium hamelinense]